MTKNIYKNRKYENCTLVRPDGRFLARCASKRVNWYVSRNLAEIIQKDPIVARLKFEPNGPGKDGDLYYMQLLKNVCVVCGTQDTLTMHHVVPSMYRKAFPPAYKENMHHDILCTCHKCHKQYEVQYAENYKKEIFEKYLPHYSSPAYQKQMKDLQCIIIQCHTHKRLPDIPNVPAKRIKQQEDRLIADVGYLPNDRDLEQFEQKFSTWVHALNCGKLVVECMLDSRTELGEFIKAWRNHFIETMKPKFLPEHWSIDKEYTCERDARDRKTRLKQSGPRSSETGGPESCVETGTEFTC